MYTFRGIASVMHLGPGVLNDRKKNQQLLTRPTVREKNKCLKEKK